MRRTRVIGTVVVLAVFVLAGSSIAIAAKPVRSLFVTDPFVHEGDGTQVCDFAVELSQTPDSNYTLTEFGDFSEPGDRLVVTGSGHDRALNTLNGKSVTLPTSGKVTQTLRSDGTLRLQASGRTLLYFYKGDLGPFVGEAGDDGGLYYIVGHVDEILDPALAYAVTSFKWSGKATELCSLID